MKRIFTILIIIISFTAHEVLADETGFSELYANGLNRINPVSIIHIPSTKLLFFWRSDCAPCNIETNIIRKFAKENQDVQIFIIDLKDAQDAESLKGKFNSNVHIAISDENPEKIFKFYGNEKLSLPYSVALDKQNKICGRHNGITGTDLMNKWLKSC